MDRLEPAKCSRETSDSLTAADAFSLVGDETRVKILEALWQIDEHPVPFSTLYETVDTDTSAQFNYHLDKLTGHFVIKTGDGYELRAAGENVVRAIVEGSMTAHPKLESFRTGDDCVTCRGELQANYSDETLSIDCPACGRTHGEYSFPPGGLLDRTEAEILRAFDHHVRHLHALATRGVCPACRGRTRVALTRERADDSDNDLVVEYTCEQCHHSLQSTVGLAILNHPTVAAFCHDNDFDIRSTPFWRLDWCVSDESITVKTTDPWQLEMPIPVNGARLVVTIDGDMRILDTRREETPHESPSSQTTD